MGMNMEKSVINVSPYSARRTKRNYTIGLFTARAFLPGLFERKAFLIVSLMLPLLDFATDCVNAGTVLLEISLTVYLLIIT